MAATMMGRRITGSLWAPTSSLAWAPTVRANAAPLVVTRGLLSPAKSKFRKHHKGRVRGFASSGTEVNFGLYGLQALAPVRMTANQIEAARRAISRKVKRVGQVWTRIFPDISVSKKPAEVRMGKGKGAPDHWICRVQANKVLFEVDGVPRELAQQAFALAAAKLPIRTKMIDRPAGYVAPTVVASAPRAGTAAEHDDDAPKKAAAATPSATAAAAKKPASAAAAGGDKKAAAPAAAAKPDAKGAAKPAAAAAAGAKAAGGAPKPAAAKPAAKK